MTAFKFQIYNPGGSSDFEFDDDGIVAFWLAENISGMSADLERRSVHQGVLNPFKVSSEAQNSFAVTTKAQNSKDSLAETEAFCLRLLLPDPMVMQNVHEMTSIFTKI